MARNNESVKASGLKDNSVESGDNDTRNYPLVIRERCQSSWLAYAASALRDPARHAEWLH